MARKPDRRRQDGEAPDGLDPRDADLWERVARTAEPLKKDGGRVRLRDERPAAAAPEKPNCPRKAAPAPDPVKQPARDASPPAPPPLGAFDRREAKGLGSGRVEIGARVDLHGMRQREAHATLKAFLARAQREGHRHVLVITGKGTARGSAETENFYETPGDRPGVLRRTVPQWLGAPELRSVVVSCRAAAPRHGGEGALYVRLRKPDRGKRG